MTAAPLRPVLRYHGGKFRLAEWIIGYFPEHRIYVEPYGGAASVLMHKNRVHAEVYNDVDGRVVNVFKQMRDPIASDAIARRLYYMPFARDEFDAAFEHSDDPIEDAARTIIRSFMGFGAGASTQRTSIGFRTNSNRAGTTPAREWSTYHRHIGSFCERLRGVVVENRPALEIIQRSAYKRPDCLVYLDPPYVHSTRTGRQGYKHEMGDDDHRALAAVAKSLPGMVVVSGYRCDLYDELYGDWQRFDINVRAMMNLDRVESLWVSPNSMLALRKQQVEMNFLVSK